MRKLILIVSLIVSLFVFAACAEQTSNDASQREANARDNNYTGVVNKQPAGHMDYSPTRDTINHWMNTWSEKGKVSYVYLLASNGQNIGYFVFKGLPVSYCASLTSTENQKRFDTYDGDQWLSVPAPSMDGVYYSGGECSQYYGYDAVSGNYYEFNVGNGINFFVSENPLPSIHTQAIGDATINNVK